MRPLVRVVVGQVPGPAAILLRGLARATEVLDEVLSFFELLRLEAEDGADLLKPQGQAVVSSPYQGASPGGRIEVVSDRIAGNAVGLKVLRIVLSKPYGQTDSLKRRIIGGLDHRVIGEGTDDLVRDGIPAGEIIHGDGAMVYGYAKKQNLKVR